MGSQYMQNKGMAIPFTQNMNLSNYKANSHSPLTAPGLDLYGIKPLTILLAVTNTLNGLLQHLLLVQFLSSHGTNLVVCVSFSGV